jgi:hypothetical protein
MIMVHGNDQVLNLEKKKEKKNSMENNAKVLLRVLVLVIKAP